MLFYVGSFSYLPHAVLRGESLTCPGMWGVSLTRLVLFMWGSYFSYTPRAVLRGEFLTCPRLLYVGSFSYTPRAVYVGIVFLLHAPCCVTWVISYMPQFFFVLFLWGVSLTCLMLCYMGNFLHAPVCLFFMWGVSLTRPVLFMWRSCFSYTPCAVLRGDFPLHDPSCVMWEVSFACLVLYNDGISLTRPMLFDLGSFSYAPCAILCGEFLLVLHALCCFM